MKDICHPSLLLFFTTLIVAVGISVAESQPINSFKSIKSQFKNPPVEFRSAPLWVWNDDVNEAEIDLQLQELQQGGLGGVFIHPRPGLITSYLSDRWFELCRYTVDKAKELGMEVWLYDENSYPSGFAGGNVPAQMPESYNQGQGLIMKHVEQVPADAEDAYFIVLKKEDDKFVDITADLAQEKDARGDYYLFEKKYYKNSPWHGGYSYVDLLVPGVTEKFIDVTMTGYEKAIGDEFGNLVPGIFTDEPNINPPGGAKFTPSIFVDFKKRWGYDLKANLPSLFEEIGDWQMVRHNFYSLLLDLFIDRWSKPWFAYCEKNNLTWTGHYWEHGWPKPTDGSDNMAMYAWHQMPAIDMLMNQYSESVNAQFGNVRSVKELASIANQMGRTRTLSETYGAGGWDLRFEDMKRIGDWQYVLGVNFLNQHLSYITIKGARKRDHPQSFSYHEPWWKFYKASGDYFARLSLALSSGKQVNDILVLEPTTTAWMYYSPSKSNSNFDKLGPKFQQFVTDLEFLQIEYDLGSENTIKTWGKVDDYAFVVGERAYKCVVLPPAFENIDSEVLALLQKFLANGGRVLSFVDPPQYVDGSKSTALIDLASRYSNQWKTATSLSGNDVIDQLVSPAIHFEQPRNISGKLFHHRRVLEDGQLVFLVNTSDEEWSHGAFTISGASVQEMGLDCGCLSSYPAKAEGDKLNIDFDIPPSGSLLLYVNAGSRATAAQQKKGEMQIVDSSSELNITRVSPNALTLDWCDLTLAGKTDKDIYFFKAADKIFRHYGFNGNPWSTSVQYKTSILDRDKFPQDSGFQVDFYFDVENKVNTRSLKAAVERPELWTLFINGKEVAVSAEEQWLDRAIGVYDIGAFVKAGKNKITLSTSPMTVHTELEPIYLLGDFHLQSQDKGWKLVPSVTLDLNSWKDQGLPFYSDGVEYTKTLSLDSKNKRHIVKLTDWLGSVAQVKVNGKEAGLIYSSPYELDITDSVVPGKNTISVTVYGTLKNLLGPHHIGVVRGTAWPHSFQAAPQNMPAGKDYDFIDYGLFKDFVVIESSGAPQRVYWRNYKAATPVFQSFQQIHVDSPATIQLACATKGAEIRYTLDGSEPDESSTIYSAPFTMNKSATIKVRAFKKNMSESDIAVQSVHIVDSQKNGLFYKYYEGVWEDIPNFADLETTKSGQTFGFDVDDLKQRNAQFAFHYVSKLEIDSVGDYVFFLNSNDGSRLFIDGKLIVDNGGSHGLQERQGSVFLSPGKHALEIHYFDSGGSQALELYYKGPNLEKQHVRPEKLFID